MYIKDNIEAVKQRMQQALEKAGRSPQDVRLIAVSKTKPIEDIRTAAACGMTDFGENYVQEIEEKYPLMPEGCRIHMIGHLQTNKVRKVIDKVCMIHSVDSLHLAEAISKEAVKRDLSMDILLEVNIGDESSKFGFAPSELIKEALSISGLPGINIKGLMTSAPITEDPETNRPYFRHMKELLIELRSRLSEAGIPEDKLPTELSMGMTGDYIPAIEEGATMIRVGTAIFGPRQYHR